MGIGGGVNGIAQLIQMLAQRANNPNRPMSEAGPSAMPSAAPVNPGASGGNMDEVLKELGMGTASPLPQSPGVVNQTQIPMIPISPKVRPDIQFGTPGEFRTSSGNKRNSINNLFGTVNKMVTAAQQNQEQRKIRDLSLDLERLMIAAQNPDDPHNKEVINDILGDAKKRKAIAEALNIKFGPVEDDRSPEGKAALQKAVQAVQTKTQAQPQMQGGTPQSGQPTPQPQAAQPQPQTAPQVQQQQGGFNTYAQQFMRQMPNAQVMSPQFAASMQMLQRMAPYFSAMSRERASENLAMARVEAQKIMTQARSGDVLAQNQAKIKAAQILANARIKDAQIRVGGMLDNTLWKAAGQILVNQEKQTTNNQQVLNLKRQYDAVDKQMKELQGQLQAAQKDSGIFTSGGRAAAGRVLQLEKQIDDVGKQQQQIIQQMNQLNMGAMNNGNNTSSTGAGSAGDKETGGSSSSGIGDAELDAIFSGSEGEEEPQ